MTRARRHPFIATAVALSLATAAVAAIAWATGWGAFGDAWTHLHPGWIALAAIAWSLASAAYVVAYRSVAAVHGGPRLSLSLTARVVAAGFGPFAPGGGFAMDKRALYAIEDEEERAATVRVLGLGALEWALLAPAAWLSAVVLLVAGNTDAMPSLLWPWAIAVPVGFALGLWRSRPQGRRRKSDAGPLQTALHGVGILHALLREPFRYAGAWLGIAAYWALDILSLYGALRFIGLRPNAGQTIIALATGYALTRRSLPLAGAGVTEALMTYALRWVGEPVAPALAAVLVYRVFNFVLPTVPALVTRRRVVPLLDAAERGETPAIRERRYARGETKAAA